MAGIIPMDFVMRGEVSDGIADTAALAQRAEELGYDRYWIGEHHFVKCESPEPAVLASILASYTDEIRIGVMATLLQYRTPLHLAHMYLTIERMLPQRVEMGMVPTGADSSISHAYLLREDVDEANFMDRDHFAAQFEEFYRLVTEGELPEAHKYHNVSVEPQCETMLNIVCPGGWTAARLAARFGLPLALSALHHGKMPENEAVEHYLEHFTPKYHGTEPSLTMLVGYIIADSESEVERCREMWSKAVGKVYVPLICGKADEVITQLRALVQRYGADSVAVVDCVLDLESRMEHLEFLSRYIGKL